MPPLDRNAYPIGTRVPVASRLFILRIRMSTLLKSSSFQRPREIRNGIAAVNALVHRETILMTPDADAAASQLSAARVRFVSSGIVANHMQMLDFSKAFLVRDPDGHAIEIAAQ